MRPHGVEKRRPDDGGLAASAQRLQVFVTAQAKTEGAGKSGGGTHAVEQLKGLGGNLGACSRGARDADAIDEPARTFYLKYSFIQSPVEELTVMLDLSKVPPLLARQPQ